MANADKFAPGAMDLSELKARAEAQSQSHQAASPLHQPPAAQQPQQPQPGQPQPGQPQQRTGGGLSRIVTVTPENFENDVVVRSTQGPVVVLIGSSRSPQSEQLKKDFTELVKAQPTARWIFAYVDADEQSEVAAAFGIQGLPTTLALAAGRPLANFEGGQPREALQQWTNAVVEAIGDKLPGFGDQPEAEPEPEPSDPRFDAAAEHLNNGDFDAAVAAYDKILASEPKNKEARAARGNALLLSRAAQRQSGENVDAAAGDKELEAIFAQADDSMLRNDEASAFSLLLDALRERSGEEKDAAKTRLLELLELCDPQAPHVLQARRDLANALF